MERGYSKDRQAVLKRLRRVEGQIRGLQRMVEEEAYCIDVLTQVSAATRALQEVALGLLDEHLGHCVREAIESGGPEADAKVAAASKRASSCSGRRCGRWCWASACRGWSRPSCPVKRWSGPSARVAPPPS